MQAYLRYARKHQRPEQYPQIAGVLSPTPLETLIDGFNADEAHAEIVARQRGNTPVCMRDNVEFWNPVRVIMETNLLEEPPRDLETVEGTVDVYLRPFEIETVRVR